MFLLWEQLFSTMVPWAALKFVAWGVQQKQLLKNFSLRKGLSNIFIDRLFSLRIYLSNYYFWSSQAASVNDDSFSKTFIVSVDDNSFTETFIVSVDDNSFTEALTVSVDDNSFTETFIVSVDDNSFTETFIVSVDDDSFTETFSVQDEVRLKKKFDRLRIVKSSGQFSGQTNRRFVLSRFVIVEHKTATTFQQRFKASQYLSGLFNQQT
jgi:hypothetical protein